MEIKQIIDNLDFTPGQLTYFDCKLNTELRLEQQLDYLKEDLIQIVFPLELIFDVGWYSSFWIEGSFQVQVIHKYNWEQPIWHAKVQSLNDLCIKIREALSFCQKYIDEYQE